MQQDIDRATAYGAYVLLATLVAFAAVDLAHVGATSIAIAAFRGEQGSLGVLTPVSIVMLAMALACKGWLLFSSLRKRFDPTSAGGSWAGPIVLLVVAVFAETLATAGRMLNTMWLTRDITPQAYGEHVLTMNVASAIAATIEGGMIAAALLIAYGRFRRRAA